MGGEWSFARGRAVMETWRQFVRGARRSGGKTLLVDAVCGGSGGFAFLRGGIVRYPGEPRLGSAPLGCIPQPFQGWRMRVRWME